MVKIETILFADDKQILRMSAEHFLKKNGYTVITASSGNEAIEKLEKASSIQLAILDYQMPPGKDGLQTATEIKKIRNIPIILFTSKENITVSNDEIDCLCTSKKIQDLLPLIKNFETAAD